jgi:hypothetical protein
MLTYTVKEGSTPSNCTVMENILAAHCEAGDPRILVAPHLLGYIGEHISFYEPGAKQLAGVARSFGGKFSKSHY